MHHKNKTLLLITIATIARCIIGVTVELGNDEVYYRMYAQDLQWNYFDHPPMVGWLISICTGNLLPDNEFFIRIGAVIASGTTTWLLYLSGKRLSNEYTGFLAAVIYTATIYGSIIAGTFILPDSPQMVCWSACLYLLIGITENKRINREKKSMVLWFGFMSGIGMLCKIHSCFLWLGFLLFIIFYNIKWLKQPALYISMIITILFFYPVIKWNIDNNFVTYLYHSKRVDVAAGGFSIISFLTFAGGQVFYSNPVIFPFIMIATAAAIKNKLTVLPGQKNLLLLCSLPLIVLTLIISFFKNVLPHWPAPAYSGLILLTAAYFSNRRLATGLREMRMPKPLVIGIALLTAISIGGVLLINYLPGTFGKKEKEFLGERDFTLDMYGWNDIRSGFQKILQRDNQTGLMKPGAVIISNKWFTASHIDYYIAMPLKKDLIAIGDTDEIHQYAWLNKKRKKLYAGDDAYCIVPSENYFEVEKKYSSLFGTILSPEIIAQKRTGKFCRMIYVYRLKNYLGK